MQSINTLCKGISILFLCLISACNYNLDQINAGQDKASETSKNPFDPKFHLTQGIALLKAADGQNILLANAALDKACRLCMRLNRSIALSRRRKGKCEFSALLFAHRLVTCFSAQPSSLAAAL